MFKEFVKKLLKKFRILTFTQIILKLIKKKHPLQRSKNAEGYKVIYLGTEYGGWSFVDEDNLHKSTIISAGLGEDASFDIEFASKYNAKVVIVDPTPRAIKHFNQIINSLGKKAKTKYVEGGNQPISAYDLSSLDKNNFYLVERALWNKNELLKFYCPRNPLNVSHSIINFQNKYDKNSSFIEVEAITIEKFTGSNRAKF